MPQPNPQLFANASGLNSGTQFDAQQFNSLYFGQSCLLTGTLPTSNGSGLSVAIPALTVLVNTGTDCRVVPVTAVTPSVTAVGSKDTFFYVNTSGVVSQSAAQTIGVVPSVPANSMTLCKATTNAGGTIISSIVQMCPSVKLASADVALSDLTESVSTTPLAPTSTVENSLQRVRQVLTTVFSNAGSFANLVGFAANSINATLGDLILSGRLRFSGSHPTWNSNGASLSASSVTWSTGSCDSAGQFQVTTGTGGWVVNSSFYIGYLTLTSGFTNNARFVASGWAQSGTCSVFIQAVTIASTLVGIYAITTGPSGGVIPNGTNINVVYLCAGTY